MSHQDEALRAEQYALTLIISTKPRDITEAIVASMCAYESLHEKTPAARVGCAHAVQTWLSTRTLVGQKFGDSAGTRTTETPKD
jgi:lysozyme family protein